MTTNEQPRRREDLIAQATDDPDVVARLHYERLRQLAVGRDHAEETRAGASIYLMATADIAGTRQVGQLTEAGNLRHLARAVLVVMRNKRGSRLLLKGHVGDYVSAQMKASGETDHLAFIRENHQAYALLRLALMHHYTISSDVQAATRRQGLQA